MKRAQVAFICSVAILALLAASGVQLGSGAQSESERTAASAAARRLSKTIIVASTADSGPGTLRQALLDAQSGDTITFDPTVFPPAAPVTITLNSTFTPISALPHVNQGNLTIDASNAGVILDGSQIPGETVNGLEIYSSVGNTIRGLQFVNFSGTGITLCGGSNNTIGGDRSIGTGPLGQGNLTSNNNIGIDLCSQEAFASITGNLVGTDPSGTKEWGNWVCGICIENGVHDTMVGPDNIIANNENSGIWITGMDAFGNTITQNSIHNNKGLGILLMDYGNTELKAPAITDFDLGAGTIMGATCANCTVEIFSDSSDEGETYEGRTVADEFGVFSWIKGSSFNGPHLTTTTTDDRGNTSEFSGPTFTSKSPIFQTGNLQPKTILQSRQSGEFQDNRIGAHLNGLWYPQADIAPNEVLDATYLMKPGFKRVRLAINNIDSDSIDWDKPEFTIEPSHDDFITSLSDNGVTITFMLSFWDKAYKAGGGEIPIPRFKTEDEIQRYLDFVKFIVQHFKDRIKYYEIWNEPEVQDTIQWIEVEDYINLVRRAVPVIRREHTDAKIQVGGIGAPHGYSDYDYLFNILRSDIMPLVDVVSWHPMYGTSPEDDLQSQYYYDYPSIVSEIKQVASAHGFTGEYVADELVWRTQDLADPRNFWEVTYGEIKCSKYVSRGILMHLGMDFAVSIQIQMWGKPPWLQTIQNLSTTMAGAEPTDVPVHIQSTAMNTVSYAFSLSNGDYLIAVWNDGVAVDDDPGIPATLTFPGITEHTVIGIDVLHGFQQQLITSEEDGNLVIRELLVKDYPIILRVTPTKSLFLPSVLKDAVVSEVDR